MTAFGRSSKEAPIGTLAVEIQSLNRKYLDVQVFIPRELARFEIEIRKWIGGALHRGQVQVRVYFKSSEEQLYQTAQLEQLKVGWENTALALGYEAKAVVTLPFLVKQLSLQPQQQDPKLEERVYPLLKEGVQEALAKLIEMKHMEGEVLASDILSRLETIENALPKVAEHSATSVEKCQERLKDRLRDFPLAQAADGDRLLREVMLFADKLDVSEELTRLRSHVEQFRHLMRSKEESVGKTLDFLTQELGREANTIASKSQGSTLSHLVVAIKSEIEKIREQIQNIE